MGRRGRGFGGVMRTWLQVSNKKAQGAGFLLSTRRVLVSVQGGLSRDVCHNG